MISRLCVQCQPSLQRRWVTSYVTAAHKRAACLAQLVWWMIRTRREALLIPCAVAPPVIVESRRGWEFDSPTQIDALQEAAVVRRASFARANISWHLIGLSSWRRVVLICVGSRTSSHSLNTHARRKTHTYTKGGGGVSDCSHKWWSIARRLLNEGVIL